MKDTIVLSNLGHTWIFDIDGTLVKHNGYLIDGFDTLLPGVQDFFNSNIRKEDYVILLTSRKKVYKNLTVSFLKKNGIRYDSIIFELPFGERVLINDCKPSGLKMSKSIDLKRDCFDFPNVIIDEEI